jgi:hypothetical protein
VSFAWKRSTDAYVIDPEYGFTPLGARVLVMNACSASPSDIDRARDIVLQSLAATDSATVLNELARLRLCTVSRNTDGEDFKLMLRVYTDRIAQFPEDVAVKAMRDWSERKKWWPALGELVTEMNDWMADRRAMLAELEQL